MTSSGIADSDSIRSVFLRSSLSSRYELHEEIGRGAMGVVFRGVHRFLNQQVAIKFHSVPQGIDRFQREAQLLSSIRSANVVSIQDFDFLDNGQAVLVMPWISGSDLGRLLLASGENLEEKRVTAWMRQVCSGMRITSEQGIVHRDLKPSNILVDSDDNAYVADFGLARSIRGETLTYSGGVMGTPLYMAPEQAEDPRSVDCRADIYSFGATFYHALTGSTPFSGESWFSILLSHKTVPLESPKSRNPSLTDRINDCLEKCLAKLPRDRFQTFDELADQLQAKDGETDPWLHAGGPEAKSLYARYQLRRSAYLGDREVRFESQDVYRFSNGRTCSVSFGDLVEHQVDALVSSDDESLTMGGGISAHLWRHAGDKYREMVRHFAPVRPGRAVVTPAGELRARYVMHGITMGKWNSDWVSPSRDLLNEIMESCFYHADTLGLRTIAFPLLGTGAGRFSREVCLDTMFSFLIRKLSTGLTTIQEARIVIRPLS